MIGEASLADAILDRIVNKAHRLTLGAIACESRKQRRS
ncbi:hypothetical protein [Mesorhizobium sp. M0814]